MTTKTTLIIVLGILCANCLPAQETSSQVIHQYSYVRLSGGYVPAQGGLPALGGFGLDGAYTYRNCMAWLNVGSLVDTGDAAFGASMSRMSGGVGYVFRLDQNRINLLPRLGVSYLKITQDDLFGPETTLVETTAVEPSVRVSFAVNDRLSLDAGYALDAAVDSGATVSKFNLGTTFAFAKRWGVRLEGTMATDHNYNGLFAGVEFHF